MKKLFFPFFVFIFAFVFFFSPGFGNLGAQEFSSGEDSGDFGFGFPGGASSSLSVKIGGEARAEFTGFFDDFASAARMKEARLGDIFSSDLDFTASASSAEAVIKLDLAPVFDGTSPVEIDEAYMSAFFGPLTITGGLRKLSWGKADSFGPLDVINPLDYTDLTKISDPQSVKIARPLIHASLAIGSFSKLEAVFVPWFRGDSFAVNGRWAPNQINDLREAIEQSLAGTEKIIKSSVFPQRAALLGKVAETRSFLEESINSGSLYPDTYIFKYLQGGLRFTTTIASSDFGFQYYFGRLPRPSISGLNPYGFFTPTNPIDPSIADLHPNALRPEIAYNYYHQIGADFARVIAGFNLRAEAGANITKDLDGKDGEVYNPALVWSLGFDRDLSSEININIQGTGRLRLFHGNIGSDPLLDCEAGSGVSSTRITGILSRKFFRDEFEFKAAALWGIEDEDFLFMPSLVWSRNSVSAEVSAGFFVGDKEGELGQYGENSFARIVLSYAF